MWELREGHLLRTLTNHWQHSMFRKRLLMRTLRRMMMTCASHTSKGAQFTSMEDFPTRVLSSRELSSLLVRFFCRLCRVLGVTLIALPIHQPYLLQNLLQNLLQYLAANRPRDPRQAKYLHHCKYSRWNQVAAVVLYLWLLLLVFVWFRLWLWEPSHFSLWLWIRLSLRRFCFVREAFVFMWSWRWGLSFTGIGGWRQSIGVWSRTWSLRIKVKVNLFPTVALPFHSFSFRALIKSLHTAACPYLRHFAAGMGVLVRISLFHTWYFSSLLRAFLSPSSPRSWGYYSCA